MIMCVLTKFNYILRNCWHDEHGDYIVVMRWRVGRVLKFCLGHYQLQTVQKYQIKIWGIRYVVHIPTETNSSSNLVCSYWYIYIYYSYPRMNMLTSTTIYLNKFQVVIWAKHRHVLKHLLIYFYLHSSSNLCIHAYINRSLENLQMGNLSVWINLAQCFKMLSMVC